MTTQIFRIPFLNIQQRFDIDLSGVLYKIENVYNTQNETWEINLYDGNTGDPIILSLPLVTGTDLLSQYKYLGIPGKLFCYTDGDEFARPTLDDLGTEANLYYIVDV